MSENLKLWDIIDSFISGDWGNEEESPEAPCCVSCIRGADIVPICNSDFDNIPIRYISNRSFTTHCLQEGDIIVEKSGGSPTQSTGRVVYISKELLAAKHDIVCSNFCVAFRVKPEWNSFYIYYYLRNVYNAGVFFNFEGKTSGIKNLDIETAFRAIPIKAIAMESQISIATAISCLDKKIALNRAINDNLEAMAKQLYDYWFVQFDFPNEEGNPYKSSGGKMVWNDKLKREIPEGWEVVYLADFADIKNGATPSTTNPLNYGGDIVWITPKDLSDQKSKFVYRGERNISQLGYDSCSTNLLPVNSVLLSSRAPIGLVSIAMTELCTNQGFKNLVPHDDKDSLYLYYYIKHHVKQIEQLGTGTTFKEVSREELCKFPILTPSNTLDYTQWVDVMTQIANKQFILTKEVESLTKQRDDLLPLLMNGQVSVNYHLSDD